MNLTIVQILQLTHSAEVDFLVIRPLDRKTGLNIMRANSEDKSKRRVLGTRALDRPIFLDKELVSLMRLLRTTTYFG